MTVRNPLFINSDGDLQEMTDAQVVLHQQKAIYHYSLDPSALLTVVSNSGANMASIDDTRLQLQYLPHLLVMAVQAPVDRTLVSILPLVQ